MHIEIRKLETLDGFNAKGFCIDPQHWKMRYGLHIQALRKAEELARNCDGICIAIVHDEFLGEYVLAENNIKWDMKFILFNAVETKNKKGAFRVYTYDKKTRETLLEYWIKYEPDAKM